METKKLTITGEAYDILVNAKRPDESFSDYILRLYGKKKN